MSGTEENPRRSLPAKSIILRYWVGRGDLAERLDTGWSKFDGIYLEAPHCWACRKDFGNAVKYLERTLGRPLGKEKHWTEAQINTAWNAAPLRRCHVVPHALGGSADPSNLVLLCKRCHEAAPDVIDAAIMWEWIRERELDGDRNVRERTEAVDSLEEKWSQSEFGDMPMRSCWN